MKEQKNKCLHKKMWPETRRNHPPVCQLSAVPLVWPPPGALQQTMMCSFKFPFSSSNKLFLFHHTQTDLTPLFTLRPTAFPAGLCSDRHLPQLPALQLPSHMPPTPNSNTLCAHALCPHSLPLPLPPLPLPTTTCTRLCTLVSTHIPVICITQPSQALFPSICPAATCPTLSAQIMTNISRRRNLCQPCSFENPKSMHPPVPAMPAPPPHQAPQIQGTAAGHRHCEGPAMRVGKG